MEPLKPLQGSFAAGALTPRKRYDLDQELIKKGVDRAVNTIPSPQGSMISRSGCRYVSQCKPGALVNLSLSEQEPYFAIHSYDEIHFYDIYDEIYLLSGTIWGDPF